MTEKNKKKVYVLTDGLYSDYHIVAIFSAREIAEAALQVVKNKPFSDDPSIEEWEVDSVTPEQLIDGYRIYSVCIDNSGTVKEVKEEDNDRIKELGKIRYENEAMCVLVLAESERQAVKMADEKRKELAEMERWQKEEEEGW